VSTEYRVSRVDPGAARTELLRIWRDNLPLGCDAAAKFAWTYEAAPHRPDRLYLLDARRAGASGDGVAIGAAGVAWRPFQLAGRPARGALLFELAVDRSHRTGFPALRLVAESRRAALRDFDFAYGFPTERAEPLFRRCGYSELGRTTRYVRVLRHADYLRRALDLPLLTRAAAAGLDGARLALHAPAWARARARLRLELGGEPDSRVDDLWRRAAGSYQVVGARTAEFLRWRFLRHPEQSHELVLLVDRAGLALHAYGVLGMQDRAAHLHDFFGEPAALGALIDLLLPALVRRGARSLSLRFLGDARVVAELVARGFAARDRSRAVIFSPGDAGGGPAAAACDPASWFLTDADHEWW
jgi:hypothetical protein